MPEEELEAQNTGEETPEPAQPEGGEEKNAQEPVQEEEPQEEVQEDKEAKKQRDFERAFFKEKETIRTLKEENERLRSQVSSIPEIGNLPEPQNEEQQAAINLLKSVVNDAVAPIASKLEESEREKAIDEVGKMSYSGDFADEIAEEMERLPSAIPFKARLIQARNNVIAANLDTIMENNRNVGKEEAYNNQAIKKTKVLGNQPSKANNAETKSLFQKFQDGELTPEEYAKNRDEIDKQTKAELGI